MRRASFVAAGLALVFGFHPVLAEPLGIREIASIVEAERFCNLHYDEKKLQDFIESAAKQNKELAHDLIGDLPNWLDIVRQELKRTSPLGKKIFCQRIESLAKENGFLK